MWALPLELGKGDLYPLPWIWESASSLVRWEQGPFPTEQGLMKAALFLMNHIPLL